MIIPPLRLFLLFCLLSGSAQLQLLHAQPGKDSAANPLLADPTVFHVKDSFYLYGTSGKTTSAGFEVYTSKDLCKWKHSEKSDGLALKKGESFGTANFWAPQVFAFKDSYYMAYAANERIAIARSSSPLGPFRQDTMVPLDAETKQIDPFVFIDDDGKIYLYYVVVANGGNRIYVAQMNGDLKAVKGSGQLCIEATETWENTGNDKWSVTEGPTVVKHHNLYYLFYSANHFRSPDYSVGYAISSSPAGPWKKYDGNPILSRKQTGYNGSGHGDLVKDGKGNWFYVFHTHYSNEKTGPRKTAIVRIKFVRDKKSGIDRVTLVPGSFRYISIDANNK